MLMSNQVTYFTQTLEDLFSYLEVFILMLHTYKFFLLSKVFCEFWAFAIDIWSSPLDKKHIYLQRVCPSIHNDCSSPLSWTFILFTCSSANHNHMMALLQQLLYNEALSLSWRDIIVPVVCQVVQTVRPDVKNRDDDMDVRQFVHIKKVSLSVGLELRKEKRSDS